MNFDDMGPVGNESRWDVFADFHSYLLSSFPLVFVDFLFAYSLVLNIGSIS